MKPELPRHLKRFHQSLDEPNQSPATRLICDVRHIQTNITMHLKIILASCLVASPVFLSSCASSVKGTAPVQIGRTEFKGQLIPVFDAATVSLETKPLSRPYGVDRLGGKADVMVILDQNGIPLQFGVADSTDPQTGAYALSQARGWRYFPLKDENGRPILHALKVTFDFPGDLAGPDTSPHHPYLNHQGW